MSTEIEAVKLFFAALNRNDLQAIVLALDPEVVRKEFEGTPNGATYRGIGEFREMFERGRGSWAEGGCNPEEIFQNGNKVVAFVHVRVRLKGATEWNEGKIGDAFMFRGGKIVEFHSFADRDDALKWAGIAQ